MLKFNNFNAIVVGINTVLKDDPRLTPGKPKKGFKRVIIDSRLRISSNARVLSSAAREDCIVVTTRKAAKARVKRLADQNVTVWIARSTRQGQVDLKWLASEFKKQGMKKVLIEGGATLIGAALSAGIVNQMHIYIAPKLIGDRKALDSVIGLDIKKVKNTKDLRVKKIQTVGKDIFIQADVYRNR